MGKKNKQRSNAGSGRAGGGGFSRYWPHVVVLLIVVFFGLIRFRLLDIPLERDEGEYAYAGQLILQGIPPYQLAYNMKLPGTYAAYALVLAIFGQTPAGIHAGLLLANAATTVLVFFLAARLFGSLAGVVSAASYAVLSTSPSVLGFAGHATHFVALPAVGGTLLLLKAIEAKRTGLYFWSGILLGLAFLMKQPGIFFVLFAGVYFLSSEWKRSADWRGMDWRGGTGRGGMLSLGAVLPFGLACLILWRASVFSKFWFWTFVYAREYGLALSPLDGSHVLWMMAPLAIGPGAFIWLIAGVGLSAILWNQQARNWNIFLAGFLLFSFLAVCPGFYFRQHYFIVILPAVAVLAGVGVAAVTRELQERDKTRSWRFLPVLFFAFAFVYSLVEQRDFLFEFDRLVACQSLYAPNPFPEAPEIGDYIKAHSPRDARIAVLGSEPEIFFYAQRHSATGYIYVYPLMENQQYAHTMQPEMIAEIERAQPEFVVVVNVPTSWVVRPDSDTQILTWSQKYLQEHYELDGVTDILQQSEYRWGGEAKTYQPTSPYTVQVFKRRTP
jgi:hypothetical protein